MPILSIFMKRKLRHRARPLYVRPLASVVSDSVRPHRWQPTRLPHSRDSPGKNTGVGCHFLLQCMKVKSESEVAQSCLTRSDPMNCLPGSSIHGIFQARVLEWGAIAFSEENSGGVKRREETPTHNMSCQPLRNPHARNHLDREMAHLQDRN